jgi:trigger factor
LKVDYVEETSVRKSLSFELEPELVTQEIEKRAQKYARKVKIDGFRAGKVPAGLIRQRFRGQILEEAAEALVNRVVFPELDGRGLKPLAMPKIEELKIEEGQPMTFRAVFETLPLVEVPEYRGLTVTTKAEKITDEQVEGELSRLREEAARFDAVEGRPAEAGDFVLLDLAWSSDDAPSDRDENVLLEVGSSENHPDLNDALIGLSPGETRELKLSYPADFPKKGLAGRTLFHTLTVKGIKQKVLPPLDDELAKDVGEFESLEALRQEIRKRLEAAEARRLDREQKNALVEALVQKCDFEVPEALVERHMNARTEGAARSLAFQGVDPSEAGIDWRQFRESQREASVKAARADLVLDEIARREKIEVHDAELDTEVGRYAARAKKSREAMRAQLEKDGEIGALRARLRDDKVLDLLKANARLEIE